MMRTSHRLLTATAGLLGSALLLVGCGGSESETGPGDGTSQETTPPAESDTGTPTSEETSPETSTGAEEELVFDLETGDCVADVQAIFGGEEMVNDVENVGVIDCAEPHTGEVFHIETLPDGEIPAVEELSATAEESCLAQFEPFVGVPYLQSELEIAYLHPTPQSWAQGDRDILCVLTSPEPTEGSAQQTAA